MWYLTNPPIKTFMHALYRGTHWLRFWAQMEQHDQDKDTIKVVCRKMESIAMQIFIDHGWRFSNRLCG
jgi:hypothetical protein